MTGNGLSAQSYVKLVDVDPPLAEHVLDILRDAGLAGYAEPLAGETGPYREVRAPDRPTTRIFVDRERVKDARTVVSERLPALRADFHADAAARADAADMARASAAEIDAAWTGIVEGFHSTQAPDPHIERPTSQPPSDGGSGLSARLVRQHSQGPRDYTPPEDPDDERYVPPPPPPLPRPRDRIDTLAWTGMIAGPTLVVVAFAGNLGAWLAGIGFVAFTAGFAASLWRSSSRRDDDDNGAVV